MNTMSKIELVALIQALVREARISHPVILDGEVLDGTEALDVGTLDPYPSGWIFDGTSPIGAPKSRGVEALRAELLAVEGGARFAAKLPVYHIIRWWTGPSQVFSHAVQDVGRFELPANVSNWPLTSANWDNIIDNIVSYHNQLFAFAIGGTNYTQRLRDQYRGQLDHPHKWNLAAAIAAKQVGGLDTAINLWQANSYMAYVYNRVPYEAGPGQQSTQFLSVRTEQALPDHCIYDVWWNGLTDEAVTNYYREWAKSFGARI